MKKRFFTLVSFMLPAAICLSFNTSAQQRIVSISGSISSMLCALGQESQIVGVDVTSTWPASLQQKPKVGHNRNISAEGVISLQPTLVIGTGNQINPQLTEQLVAAHIKTQILTQVYSIDGTRDLLKQVAAATGATANAAGLLKQFDQDAAALKIGTLHKKVLFIYARGAGTLMVSGTGTPIEKMITLAGADNAVTAFSDYKPLSAEALVAADPDVILLFSSGLQSIGGVEGLLKAPGVAATRAGQHKKIISMDGELLSGFDLRLIQAIKELHDKIAAQ